MSKGVRITVAIILSLILIAAIVLLVLSREGIKAIFSGAKIYTEEQVNNAHDAGVREGSANLESFKEQIKILQTQLDEKTKTINELTDKVNALQAEKKELQNTIANKDNEIGNRDELLTELETTLASKNTEIATLNEQMTSLNNEITRLNKLLEAYENYGSDKTYEVTFYVDNTAIHSQIVEKGKTVGYEFTPIKKENDYKMVFKGWSIDKVNVVNLSTQLINENTNFYAVFDKSYYSISEFTADHISSIFSISTREEFKQFSDLVNLGHTFEGKTILLLNDIDLQDYEVSPIGNYYRTITGEVDLYFSGIFDGQGHSISNFTLDNSMQEGGYFKYRFGGLFSRVINAIIKNLNLINANVISYSGYGDSILCGSYVLSSDKLSENYGFFNCSVNGTLKIGNSPSGRDGIFVGSGTNEIIHNCTHSAQVFDINNKNLPIYSNGRLTDN